MLFRGSRLVAAEDATRLSPLTPSEREFLDASQHLDERERTEIAERATQQARQNRRLQRLLGAVGVVLVVALAAGFIAFRQRTRADAEATAARAAQADAEQANELATARGKAAQQSSDEARAQRSAAEGARNEALARGLAAQSTSLLSTDQTDLALLLAVESQRFADQTGTGGNAAVEAHDSLLRALGEDPLLVRYLHGQPDLASAMAFSPDGRHFATTGDNGDIRIWDAVAGRPDSVQPEPLRSTTTSAAMSDTLLAIPDVAELSTRLWDLSAQAPWRWQPPRALDDSLVPETTNSTTVAVSQDGLLARSFADDWDNRASSVEIWDTDAGTLVAGPIDIDGVVTSMALRPRRSPK